MENTKQIEFLQFKNGAALIANDKYELMLCEDGKVVYTYYAPLMDEFTEFSFIPDDLHAGFWQLINELREKYHIFVTTTLNFWVLDLLA